jgi:pimeloyl-ACP methyl ester carboxylesterase
MDIRRAELLPAAVRGLLKILALMLTTPAMAAGNEQRLTIANDLSINVRVMRALNARGDVVYVHGATFSSALSMFHPFDQRSWADALLEADFNAWGFDFVGYGHSSRYPADSTTPRGTVTEALPQLHAVIQHIRRQNGGKNVLIVAHSWGAAVAARYASEYPAKNVKALVLFGPPVTRDGKPVKSTNAPPAFYPLSALAQYRRFIEDVPRGEAQVLSEAHFETWSREWLATDTTAPSRTPQSVITPYGPVADLTALWSGEVLYDAARIVAPVLVIRGEWDSVCRDADANRLLNAIGSKDKADIVIPRATHLTHLESQRTMLHNAVNTFLARVVKED